MIIYKQTDPRWAKTTIGESKETLGDKGCLICSICSLHSKFYPFSIMNPAQCAKDWKFTDTGLLRWNATDFPGMKFVWRSYNYSKASDEKLKKYCELDDFGVALEVETKKGGRHWLALEGPSVMGWASYDPWLGKLLFKTVGTLAPYKKITGYAIFSKPE